MAEIFVSPGVYVRERDFSYYVSSVGDSALALIGETKKGPAMRPTLMSNMGDFRETFGDLDPNKQVGYAAKGYFKYANQAYIVRVLGADALRASWNVIPIATSGGTVLATLLCSGDTTVELSSGGTQYEMSGNPIAADSTFFMVVSGAASELIYSGSVSLTETTSPIYIETLFPRNTTPTNALNGLALNHVFSGAAVGEFLTTGSTSGSTSLVTGAPMKVSGYKQARTPVIVGNTTDSVSAGVALFTVYTLSDGNDANKDVKVTIENIDTTNNTFDLGVRKFSDTNASQQYLERFPKLSMNPTDTSFVARAIGDANTAGNPEGGDYETISKYIYIEMDADAPTNAIPYGHNRIVSPFSGLTGSTLNVKKAFPQFPVTSGYVGTTSTKRQILGVNFETIDSDLLMGGWASQWDLEASSDNYIKGFHLNSGASTTFYHTASAGTVFTKATRKFVVPLLGGSDGWLSDQMTRDLLADSGTTSEITQYKAAIDTVRSTEDIDVNLLAVPGVSVDTSIGTYATELVEERADCFYIGDMPSEPTTAAGAVARISIDSNYVATYWPYVKIYDSDNSQDVTLPPTAQALEAIAYTDQVSYPWFAPAGLNRGLLTDVIRAEYKLTQEDRETLYDGKVNPIATFAGQGIAIWGQKTLQTRTTALDRINVRRMMLYVEKIIAGAALYLDFEQNDETTWDRFKSLVQPILDLVKIKRGITDFRVIMDETTNTPDMIERGQMVGQIFIKPTKTAEVILINFNLMAQGATFEE